MERKFYPPVFAILLIWIIGALPVAGLRSQPTDTLVQEAVPLQDSALAPTILQEADSAVAANNSEEDQAEAENVNPSKVLKKISFSKLFWSLVFFIIGYFIIRLLTQVITKIAERSNQSRIAFKGLVPAVRIIGWLLVIFIIVWGIINPQLETVLAVTASVGIAVGFASQDILKNIFGGVMILLDKPFQVGDKIEVGSYYGEVVEIGLRSTRIVTPDDSLVSIPNGELMNTSCFQQQCRGAELPGGGRNLSADGCRYRKDQGNSHRSRLRFKIYLSEQTYCRIICP